ncbi:xylosidase : arabinofuranosidase [Aspergillus campestris IBT 28561]|uniref:Xylosidase: arabinofuranosidase n=1 Tax=Aspergillus campestris (strain IBT 28561) TaxID=1392248 RepID=A0A2I1CVI5_ASPC2|nr:xylosidase : arabinofuranosidase [Aspergillus campestris IBT 28561]PKY01638.1 xylosidase : arabinofuranosidase [Aspergillus campestris IBT 28561]
MGIYLGYIVDKPYTNPLLPGWHSDPSCVHVPDHNDTTFCVASTFIAFPGLPIYASRDLQAWKLVSNAFSRPSQIPDLRETTNQQGGLYAPTLRYRGGKFYLIVSFLGPSTRGLVFTSADPFSSEAWGEPVEFDVVGIDPDVFWDDDDDGKVYVTSAEDQRIQHYSLDLETGETGPAVDLWNGTGGDGWYYLLIAEGGTEVDHSVMMARSRHRTGPWEPCPHNPLLTNRGTEEYFQTVGHADLFQDGNGNWWAVALGTRSGPEFVTYPMGRETVMAPATWAEGEWPVIEPVRGQMQGPLPRKDSRYLQGRGEGPFIKRPDRLDFAPGSSIPAHLVYWRYPKEDHFAVSPPGHPHTLRLTPAFANLTGDASFQPDDEITFIARRQTDTLFTYTVDVDFSPTVVDEEAGITLFLTQFQHVDMGIVLLESSSGALTPSLRLRAEGRGNYEDDTPTKTIELPREWLGKPIRLGIRAVSDEKYEFFARSTGRSKETVLGSVDARVVSGDTGKFTGTLVGVYATSNGGSGQTEAYVSRWRYEGQGQKIDHEVIVPSY